VDETRRVPEERLESRDRETSIRERNSLLGDGLLKIIDIRHGHGNTGVGMTQTSCFGGGKIF